MKNIVFLYRAKDLGKAPKTIVLRQSSLDTMSMGDIKSYCEKHRCRCCLKMYPGTHKIKTFKSTREYLNSPIMIDWDDDDEQSVEVYEQFLDEHGIKYQKYPSKTGCHIVFDRPPKNIMDKYLERFDPGHLHHYPNVNIYIPKF